MRDLRDRALIATLTYSFARITAALKMKVEDLEAAVEELAWDYLYDNHCGWENNDGAFGTFVFNVPGRTITLEHNERYTELNTSTHEF
jgi:hypothetical protein